MFFLNLFSMQSPLNFFSLLDTREQHAGDADTHALNFDLRQRESSDGGEQDPRTTHVIGCGNDNSASQFI